MNVTEIPKVSQKSKVYAMLKLGPVCGTDFLRHYIPRYAARIAELRKEGHAITTNPCRLHDHESPQVVYELADGEMSQLRFGI